MNELDMIRHRIASIENVIKDEESKPTPNKSQIDYHKSILDDLVVIRDKLSLILSGEKNTVYIVEKEIPYSSCSECLHGEVERTYFLNKIAAIEYLKVIRARGDLASITNEIVFG